MQKLARPSIRPLAKAARRTQARSAPQVTTLALTIGGGGALPTEFRLFMPGWNETENGRFLFDEEAARAVMASAQKWGVDLMIDLEHQALDAKAPPEPTARDARGWFRLELRSGELWAVGVTWTPDGAQRLSEKRQRYVSPAFSVDPDTSRITSVINVAIVAIPATHDTPALVAASARDSMLMDSELVKKALDAIETGDSDAAMEILKGLLAAAASGEEATAEEDDPAPLPDPEPLVEETAVDPEEKRNEMVAASARLLRVSGATTLGASLDMVDTWRASHLAAEATAVKLAAERAALELARRKENAIAFTKLGAETPHTTGLAKGKLCARLLGEPIDEQNTRLAALLAARGGKLPDAIKPPPGGANAGSHDLNASELAACKSTGCDPATFARLKAGRTSSTV